MTKEGKYMKEMLTQGQVMDLLNNLYEKCIQGIPKVSPPISQLAEDYLAKTPSMEAAAKSFINYQIAKCTTSGFVSGLGGALMLPIAIPANIGSVIYVQMRMIATLAYMAGFDTSSDQVQTLVYVCLAGISVDQLLKQAGIKFGGKIAATMIKKIPGQVLAKINQKVGFRFITKFGTKGIINLGKMLPVVGGFVGGGFDFIETKAIATRTYKMFIKGDSSILAQDSFADTDERGEA